MAVVKSVRLVAAKAGSVLDKEDRLFLGRIALWAGAILGSATVAGLSVAAFRFFASLG